MFFLAYLFFFLYNAPFQSASHPSALNRPTRFIIPHTPSALPTGMMYSGRVPSSSTDRRITYPCSSTRARVAGGRVLGVAFGSAKYESSADSSSSLNYGKSFSTMYSPQLQEHTASSWSSSAYKGSGSPASRGTHCTCSRSLPTSHGIAIALLVYWRTAEATKALKSCAALIPEGSDRSSEGERSNIELWDGRVDHWYDGATGAEGAAGGAGEVAF